MQRTPLSLYLVTFLGLILGILLTWEGLYIRLFTGFKNPDALWLQGIAKLGLDAFGLAWPWIVLGISWIGALAGLWLKLSWGRWAVVIISSLSLLYVEKGTILAAVALVCISLPATRRWMKEGDASAAN